MNLILLFAVIRKFGLAMFAGVACACGLFLAACATAATGRTHTNGVAVLDEEYAHLPPAFYDFVYSETGNMAIHIPDIVRQSRLYTEYVQRVAKAKATVKASPHVAAVDDRRSLQAYAKGVTSVVMEVINYESPIPFEKYLSYNRSVLIGECINVSEGDHRGVYSITIRVDHKNSPALPDLFEEFGEFKFYLSIWAEDHKIPFETGKTYMIYADKIQIIETVLKSEIPWMVDFYLGAQLMGIDDMDRKEIAARNGGSFNPILPDWFPLDLGYSPPDSLFSISPYQQIGGIDFDMGKISDGPVFGYNPFVNKQVWNDEALQYAPFIELDRNGVEGAINSKAGFLWKKWIQLAQIAQSTLKVITTSNLEAIPLFQRDVRIFGSGGRAFTEDEYQNGARVCMVSTMLAWQNGWEIGDSISLAFFNNGYTYNSAPPSNIRPIPYTMRGDQMDNPVTYKIIGFYSMPDLNYTYDHIDANTIFVPDTSIKKEYPAPMNSFIDPETGEEMIFYPHNLYLPEQYGMFSVLLKKGHYNAFWKEMKARDLGDLFYFLEEYSVRR
jgi:hypothetical protein